MDEDRELVRRCQQGDKQAFRLLVERYQRRIFSVALGMLRDEEAALDVVQEAFIRVHRSLNSYQGTASFYSWLYRIVANLCVDHYRARKKYKNHTEYDERTRVGEQAEGDAWLLPGYARNSPAKDLEFQETARLLDMGLTQLSDKLREVFLLREVDGLSYQEIADTVGCSLGTVMSRLFHARQKLQEFLRPHLGDAVLKRYLENGSGDGDTGGEHGTS